ncbi:hypothetical protein U879_10010 [Defluviimonas sp. 20V17]|nr:hypothetical protein U879_10010 [Defluviimonas sp. 20V17]
MLLLAFYVVAAAAQVWLRPAGAPPAPVSWAVFLGVGPALAAVLLARGGAWIAVFFGALFAQALIHGTAKVPASMQMILVQCDLIVAAAAAVQAVLGGRLVRGIFGVPLRLNGKGAVLALALIVGPLSGMLVLLASSLAGVAEQTRLGPNYFAGALIGWVAAIASTFIVVPLALLHPWRERSMLIWKGRALPRLNKRSLAAVLVSLALTGALWGGAKGVLANHNRQQFTSLARDGAAALQARIEAYGFGLDAAGALLRASDRVTENDWRHFVDGLGLGAHLPGVEAFGYMGRVARAQLPNFVARARASGEPNFTVHPYPTLPAPTEWPRLIVRHIAPSALKPRLLGLELGEDPQVRSVAMSACDDAELLLTPRLDPDSPAGRALGPSFMLLDPVFAPGLPLRTETERRAALMGWTFAVFSAQQLTSELYGALGRDLHLALELPGRPGAPNGTRIQVTGSHDPLVRPAFHAEQSVWLFGQPWRLIWTSTEAYERGLHRLSPGLVLVAGLAFTVLLAVFLLSDAQREELIQETVDRKTREIGQRETETRSILDTALVNIALLDEDGRILVANDAVGRTFGYHGDQLQGMMLDNLMSGATEEYFGRSEDPNDTTGFRGLVHVAARTGEKLAMDVQIKPWLTADRARRYTVVMRNVSDRLRVEAQLRDTQHRLDIALQGAQIGVFDVDLTTGESIVSDTWRALLGFDPEAQINTQAEWSSRIHPDDRAAVETADLACLKGEAEASISEYRVRVVDGAWRWMRSHAVVAERGAEGQALRLIGVQMDITEQRVLDQAKSEFVSTVSHELRTPLTSINGSLSLALNTSAPGSIPDRVLRLLQIAQKNCDRLIPLVNDILDLEKVSSGQSRFEVADEDIVALLHRAVADNQPYARQFGVTFSLISDEQEVKGRVDTNRFLQVMANLLSNAAKFSERGGTVDLRLSRHKGVLRVSVIDRGRGIPESFHDRIFQPFSQADSSSTRDKEGTGLGLNISKQIVERMGGTIGFRSDPGRETCFWFTIPLAGAAGMGVAETTAPEETSAAGRPRASGAAVRFGRAEALPARPMILHVEDDADFAEIVAASFGDRAEFVHSNRQFCLEALRSGRRFDLILLESAQAEGADAVLMDAVARLQPGVPVVALTASDKAGSDPRVALTIIKTRTRFEEIVSLCLSQLPAVAGTVGTGGDRGPVGQGGA